MGPCMESFRLRHTRWFSVRNVIDDPSRFPWHPSSFTTSGEDEQGLGQFYAVYLPGLARSRAHRPQWQVEMSAALGEEIKI